MMGYLIKNSTKGSIDRALEGNRARGMQQYRKYTSPLYKGMMRTNWTSNQTEKGQKCQAVCVENIIG